MQNDLPQFEPVLDRKRKRSDLFSCKILARFAYSPERKVRKRPGQEMNSECVFKLLHTKQHTVLLRQPPHHDPSAYCRVILGGKCAQAGIERDRYGLVENTVPFDIGKFRKFKPEFLIEWNAPLL